VLAVHLLFDIRRFMGHAKPTTTLTVYAHLFDDDHADAMNALGAMGTPVADNVIRLKALTTTVHSLALRRLGVVVKVLCELWAWLWRRRLRSLPR
jgi:hypothetical protein